jgi:hypothetical protein
MKKISGFDLAMIIAAGIVAVLGGGAWWYLSGQLAAAQADVSAAASDFDQYSIKAAYLPTASNKKVLQDNIDRMKGVLDPLVHGKLQSADNKIIAVTKQDPLAWKHDLDDRVGRLDSEAKVHGVAVPPKFYYGFSRYIDTNPGDEKTIALTKQLWGIEQIADILIDAPVKGIQTIRRTYDEDDSSGNAFNSGGPKSDKDYLPGHSSNGDGGIYAVYPFEVEFEATTDGLRKVVDDLVKSPYVFVIRSVAIQNSKLTSPQISDLDKMAPPPPQSSSVTDFSPGAVAASAKSTQGPQFLFGGETLHIKLKIDMIEWKGVAAAAEAAPSARPRGVSTPGSNQ